MCLTNDDRHLFVGQSNGEMRVFNLFQDDYTCNNVYCQEATPATNNGITHIVSFKNFVPNTGLKNLSTENINHRLVTDFLLLEN